jgi:hypothetical protein
LGKALGISPRHGTKLFLQFLSNPIFRFSPSEDVINLHRPRACNPEEEYETIKGMD